jgi:transposase-like protein
MVEKQRKRFSSEEKIRILREHLLEKVAVSEVCDKHEVQPTLFYRWQKEFFENGAVVFDGGKDKPSKKLEREIEALKAKLSHKDEVIAEIMESHVALKKSLGEI